MRVSTNMMFQKSFNSLNLQQIQANKLNEKLTTGININRPSDNPSGFAVSNNLNNMIKSYGQYDKNINFSKSDLQHKETTLGNIDEPMQKIREKLITSLNGTLNADDRKALNIEITQSLEVIDSMLKTKNSNGEYIFSGASGKLPPYDSAFNSQIEPGQRNVKYSTSGVIDIAAELPEEVNVFLKQIHTSLSSGSLTSNDLDFLDAAQNSITTQRIDLGAKINALELTQEGGKKVVLNLDQYRSQIEESDIPSVITKINQNQISLEMSMKAIVNVQKSNLFNYL